MTAAVGRPSAHAGEGIELAIDKRPVRIDAQPYKKCEAAQSI
jgi:hypothetical protein